MGIKSSAEQLCVKRRYAGGEHTPGQVIEKVMNGAGKWTMIVQAADGATGWRL